MTPNDISSPTEEIKFDRLELVDLDVLTSEEKRNLGAIWYENLRVRSIRTMLVARSLDSEVPCLLLRNRK